MGRGGKREGAGRKAEAPTKTITIYVPEPQAEQLKELAKERGLSIGKTVAMLVDETKKGRL